MSLMSDYRSVNKHGRRAVETYRLKICFMTNSTDVRQCCSRHHENYSSFSLQYFLGTTLAYVQFLPHILLRYRDAEAYISTDIYTF
jgi:hypothetical protein